MECVVLGWPPNGPSLRLDYQQFAYAGKFVMTNTGKAVIRCPDRETASEEDIIAAAAFNADRTDDSVLWIRYITVTDTLRGNGLGPRLCRFIADQAQSHGYVRIRIAVNNPFAFEALYKAGFGWTGETTGIAELILERPVPRREDAYREGLEKFRERELSQTEQTFIDRKYTDGPPEVDHS